MSQNRLALPSISKLNDNPRFLPFSIAGVSCALVAVILGYGSWYLFGESDFQVAADRAVLRTASPTKAVSDSEEPQPPKIILAPAGELLVPKGIVTLGGDGPDRPAQRITVDEFAIAETEVTNQQYFEFIKESGHQAPKHWIDGAYPPGAAYDPVINITWQDAIDYCDWLSAKIEALVRLPSEAQWELAAKGSENFKYPWGNEWDDQAAISVEKSGRVRAVKSFPRNRSPYGAYDMAGNVWEWVINLTSDQEGFPVSEQGVAYRLAKGGSANEPADFITATSRVKLPADLKSQFLGFRYAVLRGKAAPATPSPSMAKDANAAAVPTRTAEPISFEPANK